MKHDEAEGRPAELNAGGSGTSWFARERAGSWEVVKVALPPGARLEPLKETAETGGRRRPVPSPSRTGSSTVPTTAEHPRQQVGAERIRITAPGHVLRMIGQSRARRRRRPGGA